MNSRINRKGQKLLAVAVVLAFALTAMTVVDLADDSDADAVTADGSAAKPWLVNNANEFKDAVKKGGFIKLNNSFSATAVSNNEIPFDKEITIDLNGKTLTVPIFFNIAKSTTLTITGTGEISSSQDLFLQLNENSTVVLDAEINTSKQSLVWSYGGNTVIKNLVTNSDSIMSLSGAKANTVKLMNSDKPLNISALPDKFTVEGKSILTGDITKNVTVSGTGSIQLDSANIAQSKTLQSSVPVIFTKNCNVLGTVKAPSLSVSGSAEKVTLTSNGTLTLSDKTITLSNAAVDFKKGFEGTVKDSTNSIDVKASSTQNFKVDSGSLFLISGTATSVSTSGDVYVKTNSDFGSLKVIKDLTVDNVKLTCSDVTADGNLKVTGTSGKVRISTALYIGVSKNASDVYTVGNNTVVSGDVSSPLVFVGKTSTVPPTITNMPHIAYHNGDNKWMTVFGNTGIDVPVVKPTFKPTIVWSDEKGNALPDKFAYDTEINAYDKSTVATKVVSIEITKQPNKKVYNIGDEFNPTGMIVKATYDNKETKILNSTEYVCSPDGAFTTSGSKTVTVHYGDASSAIKTTTTVTVNTDEFYTLSITAADQIKSVKIDLTTDITLTLKDGKYVLPAGTYLKAGTYTLIVESNTDKGFYGTFKVTGTTGLSFTLTGGNPTFDSDGDVATAVSKTVALEYTANTAKDIVKIEIAEGFKNVYQIGQSFDKTGLKIVVTTVDNTTDNVTAEKTSTADGYTILEPTSEFTSAGTKALKVSYHGHEATAAITVTDANGFYNVVVKAPEQVKGVTLKDSSNASFVLVKKNTANEITTFEPAAYLKAGTYTIEFTYNDGYHGTSTIKVDGTAKTALSIELTGGTPSFDTSGKLVPVTHTVEATYVPSQTLDITKLEITKAGKTTYFLGDSLDKTGMVVTATYVDGHTADVTSECTADPAKFDTLGKSVSVKLKYDGHEVATSVEVTNTDRVYDVKIEAGNQFGKVFLDGVELDLTDGKYVPESLIGPGEHKITFTLKTGFHGKAKLTGTGLSTAVEENEAHELKFTTTGGTPAYGTDGSVTTDVDYAMKVSYEENKTEDIKTLEITGDFKKEYNVGDKLDKTGMKVIATYLDGSKMDVINDTVFSPETFNTAGDEITVTGTYDGHDATFKVKVVKAITPEIDVTVTGGKVTDAQTVQILFDIQALKVANPNLVPEVTLKSVTTKSISAATEILKAVADNKGSITVQVMDGSFVLSDKAIAGLELPKDKDVVFKIDYVSTPDAHKEFVGNETVMDITVTMDGQDMAKSFGEKITVTMKYSTSVENVDTENLKVFCLKADGKTEKMDDCRYSTVEEQGYMSFSTTHLSNYVTKYVEPAPADEGTSVFVYVGVVIAVLAVAAVAVIVLKKKGIF